MLIKLTGSKSEKPVLVDTSAIILAEEDTDAFLNGKAYTRLQLAYEGKALGVGVEETVDEILEKIEDAEGGFFDE